jgi:3-oxoacyl-[acyl-carrier protein] reductase
MVKSLTGYTALVTGGSKGIGSAIVEELAKRGANVAFCARESQEMHQLEREITLQGGHSLAIPTDVSVHEEIASCVKTVNQHFGGIDILVNNVGGAVKFGGFFDLDDSDWLNAFDLNVLSLVRFTRETIPYLKNSKLGRIVNISSISGHQPGSYNPHYCSTKAAVTNIGKHLSNILAVDNILVNTVSPGPVHSASWQEYVAKVSKDKKITLNEANLDIEYSESAKVPLGRIGEGHQVASVVAFLCMPETDWITGSCFHVNGGKLQSAF